MFLNYNSNLFEDEYKFTCPLFDFGKKDEDYISISPDKDFENIDLNMIIDNNLENIYVSNTDKKTNEAEPKMKQRNNSLFKINLMPYLEKDINNIIKNMNISEEKKKYLLLNEDEINEEIKNFRYDLFFKEKLRIQKQQKENKSFISSKKGRKLKNDESNRTHTKYSSDNIIKSIKTKLNDSLLLFLNKLIISIYDIKKINQILLDLNLPGIKIDSDKFKVLKKNDYKTRVKKTSKLYNLELLNLTIYEYISNNISSKFKYFPINYNKLIIQKLLEDELNKDIFNFIFNQLKIEDWLDIFIYKKEIENFINNKQLNNYKINIIKESLIRIDNNFFEIPKDDKIYLHCFELMIYNLKRYLLMKEGRRLHKIIINN